MTKVQTCELQHFDDKWVNAHFWEWIITFCENQSYRICPYLWLFCMEGFPQHFILAVYLTENSNTLGCRITCTLSRNNCVTLSQESNSFMESYNHTPSWNHMIWSLEIRIGIKRNLYTGSIQPETSRVKSWQVPCLFLLSLPLFLATGLWSQSYQTPGLWSSGRLVLASLPWPTHSSAATPKLTTAHSRSAGAWTPARRKPPLVLATGWERGKTSR